MRHDGPRDVFGGLVAQRGQIESGEKIFPAAHQHRRHGEMHFVDQALRQILPDRRYSAADPDVLSARSLARALQRRLDAVRDEIECGAVGHDERRAGVVRQNEYRGVIRRLFTPPSLPLIVGPDAADWAEHIAAKNPGADVLKSALRKLVVDIGRAALATLHRLKRARGKEPLKHRIAPDAERIFEVLIGTGAIAVKGDTETLNAEFGHKEKNWRFN